MRELSSLHPHGVFLRRDALAAGYDDRSISQARHSGAIVRVRHGSYIDAAIWDAADELEQYRLRCHAVLLRHDDGVALSHTSAAVMHGLDLWEPDLSHVHLARLNGRTTRRCSDVVYHQGRLPLDYVQPIPQGGLTTSPLRAALEHAILSSVEAGTCVLNSYLHKYDHHNLDAISAAYSTMSGFPGTARLNVTLRLIRPGVESVGESRMVFLCWENHLPNPTHQHPVYDAKGSLIGRSDLAWLEHRVLGEFDGKTKYEKYLRPGESVADALFREKRREDLIREYSGCDLIRFTWSDLYTRQRTVDRLRRKLGLR